MAGEDWALQQFSKHSSSTTILVQIPMWNTVQEYKVTCSGIAEFENVQNSTARLSTSQSETLTTSVL